MKQLQPVLWTKGTFLTPQHLQLQDRFLEDSLNFRLQALKFCAWGFNEVVLDQELLADGQLAVSRASGIFPDGLLFDIPGLGSAASVQGAGGVLRSRRSRPRHLSHRARLQGERAERFAGLAASRAPAIWPRSQPSVDDNTGDRRKADPDRAQEPAPAGRQRNPRRQLRAAHRQRGKTEAGGFRLNPASFPRCSKCAPATICAAWSTGFSRFSPPKARSSRAAAGRRTRAWPTSPPSDIANFWLLYTVNSHIPVLSHLLQGQRCHPEELFSALTALGASLTTFSPTIRPRDLAALRPSRAEQGLHRSG